MELRDNHQIGVISLFRALSGPVLGLSGNDNQILKETPCGQDVATDHSAHILHHLFQLLLVVGDFGKILCIAQDGHFTYVVQKSRQ